MGDAANRTTESRPIWRSLEERAGSERVLVSLQYEFPRSASVWDDSEHDRRRFLQLMGGSIALAGAAGCSSEPPEKIMPYVRAPEGMVAGIPLQFASAMPTTEGALGVVVESHMGRPTKIEGNPLHPASLGATNAQAQASILDLYDPDRSQTVMHLGEISTWPSFVNAMRTAIEELRERNGAGLHLLTEPITSPTLARQMREILEALPEARWHEYTPLGHENARAGAMWAFGQDVQPVYMLDNTDVIVSLDSDFLTTGAGAVRYARDFAGRRPPQPEGTEPNRLYVIEGGFTPTGVAADHRLAVRPSEVAAFALELCRRLGVEVPNATETTAVSHANWLDAVAGDLGAHSGHSLVIAGEQQSAAVHAMAYALNVTLGNVGATVRYIQPIALDVADRRESLASLGEALNGGNVELLLILHGNPVYNAPADLDFLTALKKAKQAVHVSQYDDETSQWCQWHVPVAHYLESWSDCRAFDATATVIQPLIAPLYGSKTDHEILSALFDTSPQQEYDLVRATWQQERPEGFESFWEASVRDGVISDSRAEPIEPQLYWDAANAPAKMIVADSASELEIAFRSDPSVLDGRYANNGWLQELPKPLTKLTWSNAVILAPTTADVLGVTTEDVVRIEYAGRSVEGPVLVQPGQPFGTVTVHFGYGRRRVGRIGTGIGFDAYAIWNGAMSGGVKLTPIGEKKLLARTQHHHLIDGRNIVHTATAAQYRESPPSVLPHQAEHGEASLYPEWKYDGFSWGMAIDLTKCIGCNACVVACQAENNIPIVGAEGVARGREMQWLRIDSYYLGEPDDMHVVQQPMLCQHCEKAPCEPVCPVAATTHSEEGLNEMTYNRCVGTRYCSNNCPYKVRRFNFFEYHTQDETTPVLKLLHNPDVTVRSRGVMEKCTYCVQRINAARIEAQKRVIGIDEQPRIADGTLQTACQQACPSQAIVFGDINDPNSQVAQLKEEPRNYGVLSELGTQPRTTYLVQLRNPNPALG